MSWTERDTRAHATCTRTRYPTPRRLTQSPTILRAGTYSETEHGEIKFPELSGAVLEKTVRYFYYKLRYTNYTGPGKIPEFKIDPESALELLMAANYLDT